MIRRLLQEGAIRRHLKSSMELRVSIVYYKTGP